MRVGLGNRSTRPLFLRFNLNRRDCCPPSISVVQLLLYMRYYTVHHLSRIQISAISSSIFAILFQIFQKSNINGSRIIISTGIDEMYATIAAADGLQKITSHEPFLYEMGRSNPAWMPPEQKERKRKRQLAPSKPQDRPAKSVRIQSPAPVIRKLTPELAEAASKQVEESTEKSELAASTATREPIEVESVEEESTEEFQCYVEIEPVRKVLSHNLQEIPFNAGSAEETAQPSERRSFPTSQLSS